MKSKLKLLCLPLSFMLSSASSTNFVYVNSYIKHSNIMCKKQLTPYSSESFSTLSNVKKDTVATLTFNYEVYQMYKPTEMVPTYHPGFILLYQIDIYINNAVNYKGGVGNWFNGTHAGFLNYINIKTEFDDLDYTGHKYQTPCLDSTGKTYGYRFLRGVKPNDNIYKQNSKDLDKQTFYNRVDAPLDRYSANGGDQFQDAVNIFTNSYFNYVNEVYNDANLLDELDSRLVTNLTTSSSMYKSSIVYFEQNFQFNNKVSYSVSDTSSKKVSIDSSDKLYSGPCTNGKDDSQPFNFTFYGVFAVESSKVPSTIKVDLKMDTYHGSHTALDTFESSANKSIVIHL